MGCILDCLQFIDGDDLYPETDREFMYVSYTNIFKENESLIPYSENPDPNHPFRIISDDVDYHLWR